MEKKNQNKWNERFKAQNYVYGKEPNKFLEENQFKFSQANEILCIAEGEGRNAAFLASQGKQITVWDYSEEGLKKAQQLADESNVEIKTECVDLTKADWPHDAWDAVVNIYGHFNQEDRNQVLKSAQQAIKPNGYYISEVYSLDQVQYKTGGPKEESMLNDPIEILRLFKDWKIIHFFVGEVKREEGKMHKGTAHVVQMIFQKKDRD